MKTSIATVASILFLVFAVAHCNPEPSVWRPSLEPNNHLLGGTTTSSSEPESQGDGSSEPYNDTKEQYENQHIPDPTKTTESQLSNQEETPQCLSHIKYSTERICIRLQHIRIRALFITDPQHKFVSPLMLLREGEYDCTPPSMSIPPGTRFSLLVDCFEGKDSKTLPTQCNQQNESWCPVGKLCHQAMHQSIFKSVCYDNVAPENGSSDNAWFTE